MSVSIETQGSQVYVQLSHGDKSVQIPCKDQEEAAKVAEAAKEVDKKMDAQDKAQVPQGTTDSVAQGTPSTGVGEKLDKVA